MELAILIFKGVDGVFTDFSHTTYKTFCLYGSKSLFPELKASNQTETSVVTLAENKEG